ncbi:hypothetical protein DRW42_24820 [Pedobacter miscanthi]|uniref:Lipid/polyisoprenoid-binding YceI-like domain-containing protein n=2 Tax=Pedobacter miscanthi TaxID=2259170 RepID=A0A366KMJ5_9SPHI|nr:hypothetical protein DRW42_24820 [Pedobacter miscanthi]
MKTIFFTLSLFLTVSLAMAQTVKPYLATVKTKAFVTKGVLYKVDSASLVVVADDKFVSIGITDIQSIKIKTPKKKKDLIRFVKYDPWNEDNFEKRTDGIKVRKWGEKDPTLGEEINGHIAATMVNVTGNILAAPIQSINPSIARFKINGSKEKYGLLFNDLKLFSVYYQANPNILAELQQLKAISATFKP